MQAIDLDQLIPGAKHFRWKEMLRCNRWKVHAFPTDIQYLNILKLIKAVEEVRHYLDEPMYVTSGLRPPLYNEMIGGARMSAHKIGMAMDFACKKIKADRIRELLEPVLDDFNIRMEKNKGSNWVHIDIREPGSSGRYFNP